MGLQDYRRELDRLDGELTALFAARMAVSAQVADYKRARQLPVLDPAREAALLGRIEALLPPELGGCGTALYSQILALSRARQERAVEPAAENLILIGMPGCGKNTVGALLAQRLGRPFVSSDHLVEAMTGRTIPEIFAQSGEDAFRAEETRALALLCARSGCVIATGGGCVTRAENLPLLRMGGRCIWLQREMDALAREGRPLSLTRDLHEMYAERAPRYRACADLTADNNGSVAQTVAQIVSQLENPT
ncbi:MAG: chorismate mutase [Oscillospiraceae bacterium]|nr:chorismate mutase [Oscillospiraceae bacterium]